MKPPPAEQAPVTPEEIIGYLMSYSPRTEPARSLWLGGLGMSGPDWPHCARLFGPTCAALAGGAEPVGLGAGFDDVGVEGGAVDDGGDEAGVGDDLAPFAEGEVRGQGDRGLLLAFGEDLEQELGAAGVELDVAELVEAEQVRGGQ